MSHQTGIQPNDALKAFSAKVKSSGKARVLKIAIEEEQLALDGYKEPSGDWEEDYQNFVKTLLVEKEPCYLLYRLDSKNVSHLYEWLILVWSPEGSPVRDKMLYASTKATLKKEFGNISYDLFACNQEEASLASAKAYIERKKAEENGDHDPNLLTAQEQDLRIVKQQEALSSSINKTSRTLPGVEFPISEEAINALFDLKVISETWKKKRNNQNDANAVILSLSPSCSFNCLAPLSIMISLFSLPPSLALSLSLASFLPITHYHYFICKTSLTHTHK